MAADDTSGKPAGPVVLRIKLRYDDVDAMVQRFAHNVGKSGLFLPTKSIQAIGAEVKFELRLVDDTPVLVGLGKVKGARAPDPANPKAAFGIAIELMRVTRDGRELIMRMLERRRSMGLPEVAIPMPDDIEHARRIEVDRTTSPGGADAQPPIVETQPKLDPTTVRESAPKAEPRPARESQLLTAPRPGSGPIARAKEASRPSAPALEPEAAKPKRPRVADLIARASETSGALAAAVVPGLDEHVDLERALARARVLAAGDLDAELDALRDALAAPIEISIEAASAELARQLGGAAITKRDRSARWAPPPVVAESAPVAVTESETETESVSVSETESESESESETESVSESESVAAAVAVAVAVAVPAAVAVAVPVPVPVPVSAPVPVPVPVSARSPRHAPLLIHDNSDLASLESALDSPTGHTDISLRPAPHSDDDDDIEPLDSLDLELADETEIGHVPVEADAFQLPPAPDDLADRLDQQLADAENEAAAELAGGLDAPHAYDTLDAPEGDEEVAEGDVLAEADADDADLLHADGERDATGESRRYVSEPSPLGELDEAREAASLGATPTNFDFAADLDLGDTPQPPIHNIEPPLPIEYDQPSSSFTVAEDFPPVTSTFDDPVAELDDAHAFRPSLEFDEPHGFSDPPMRRLQRLPSEDVDLEDALSTLDVDLDQLEIPHEPAHARAKSLPGMPPARTTGARPNTSTGRMSLPKESPRSSASALHQAQPARLPRAKRSATEDDGVLIDFDDDDEA